MVTTTSPGDTVRIFGLPGSLRTGSCDRAREKFDEEGRLTHEPTRRVVRGFLEALLEWTIRMRGPTKEERR